MGLLSSCEMAEPPRGKKRHNKSEAVASRLGRDKKLDAKQKAERKIISGKSRETPTSNQGLGQGVRSRGTQRQERVAPFLSTLFSREVGGDVS